MKEDHETHFKNVFFGRSPAAGVGKSLDGDTMPCTHKKLFYYVGSSS